MNPEDDLIRQARTLPRSVPPERDLWPEIAACLEETGSAPSPAGTPVPLRADRPPSSTARRWQPLAWAATLVLAVSVGFWLGRSPDPSAADLAGRGMTAAPTATPVVAVRQSPRADLQQTRAALARDIERRLDGLNPPTRAVVLDNLAVINQALDEIDAALAATTDSDLDARLLMAMYADQLVLMNTMNNTLYPSTAEIAL